MFWRVAAAASTVKGGVAGGAFFAQPAKSGRAMAASAKDVALNETERAVILSITFLKSVLHGQIYGAVGPLIQKSRRRSLHAPQPRHEVIGCRAYLRGAWARNSTSAARIVSRAASRSG